VVRVRLIDAGWFEMGSSDEPLAAALQLCAQTAPKGAECDPEPLSDERSRHPVHVPAFVIERTEVDHVSYALPRCS
jgi:formylglycine-generating enzyme required for sulfatase activity